MREILFRGKSVYTGKWAVSVCPHGVMRSGHLCDDFILETVGQFTGLTDKNGKKIFEGDIVAAKDEIWGSPFCYGITGKIVYDEASFFIEPKDVMETQYLFNECAVYEVIGNIHDNPELLEAD